MTREYKCMIKKYQKKFKKMAKDVNPWDYYFGLNFLIEHLKFMRDYYELGENVWAQEVEGVPTRLQILNMILVELNDWQKCDDKYIKIVLIHNEEDRKEVDKLCSQGYYIYKDKNNVVILHKYDTNEKNLKEFEKEYSYHRKRFFELLGTYIEYLWD